MVTLGHAYPGKRGPRLSAEIGLCADL